MTKNESKLLSLQWIAKTSAFCLLLSAFSVNAAMAVPASVGTVDEVMGVQQDKKVTGTVVDEAGIPVIGANVIQKGTTNGVITDRSITRDWLYKEFRLTYYMQSLQTATVLFGSKP